MTSAYPSYAAASTSRRPPLPARTSSTDTIARTKILMVGLRRSGKTSIQQVLFNNLPPKQTFYLETTIRIVKHTFDTVIPLEIWDCPGNVTAESLGTPLSQFSTLIFVIDIRDLYNQPVSRLVEFIVAASRENPTINLEVFVHKAEKLQEDDKIENFRQIHERVEDRLLDTPLAAPSSPNQPPPVNPALMPMNFHLTSVYDHSLHEAFSRVLHKLIGSLPYLEDLLNVFCANSQSPKAFLFDTTSRLYVATDASPVDSATHNLCCDYLSMLNSFGPLYKSVIDSPARHRDPLSLTLTPSTSLSLPVTPPPSVSSSSSASSTLPTLTSSPTSNPSSLSSPTPVTSPDVPTHPPTTTPILRKKSILYPSGYKPLTYPSASTALRPPAVPNSNNNNNNNNNSNTAPSPSLALTPSPSSSSTNTNTTNQNHNSKPASFIPGTTLTYHLITPHLALLAVVPTVVHELRRGLVEFNVVFFREGVQEICEVEMELRGGGTVGGGGASAGGTGG